MVFNTNEWGFRGEELVHIADVMSGKGCNCICPECKDPLIAKKGDSNMHHFAHQSEVVHNTCGESALHSKAKNIIKDHLTSIRLPLTPSELYYFEERQILDSKTYGYLEYSGCDVEKGRADYRPDVTVYGPSKVELDIEIMVTHGVDTNKAQKVGNTNIGMIEIDLSSFYRKDILLAELIDIVGQKAPRQWINSIINRDHVILVDHYRSKLKIRTDQMEVEMKQLKNSMENEIELLKGDLKKSENGKAELSIKLTAWSHAYDSQSNQNQDLHKELREYKYTYEVDIGTQLTTNHKRDQEPEKHLDSIDDLFNKQLPGTIQNLNKLLNE